MSKLTAAVIGTGFIGPVHVEGLRRAGISVAGVLGSTPEKSQSAADAMQIPQAYASLTELLADSHVDVVHVTSPNQHHFQQATRAIEAGKHVLCEKPLAMNSLESSQLVSLAVKKGVAAGVNYNTRFYPLCVEAAQRFRQGSVGDLFHVTGSYAQDWLFHSTDFNWRVIAEEGGSLRAVADIGTHWLDLIQYITDNKVVSVCADLATVFPKRTKPVGGVETFGGKMTTAVPTETVEVSTEDYGGVMLRFENGARGMMWVSQVTAGRKNCLQFEIAGSEQSIAWNSETPNQIAIGHRDEANQLLLRDPALITPRAAQATSYPGGHNEGFGDTFKQMFAEFYRSIESGDFKHSPSYPTFQEGHHEILVCEAILQSHQQQRWIEIGETGI
ncbi:MAG: Gfo/Idh/MocA family protein [Rubripirellula sp.]